MKLVVLIVPILFIPLLLWNPMVAAIVAIPLFLLHCLFKL